jgi:hypothetical protein
MEALVLAGLVGIGYLYNNDNKNKTPVTKQVSKDISFTSGDNIYNSEYSVEAENQLYELAKENFDKSHEEGSNVVNFQKLEPPLDSSNDIVEDYMLSSATGARISVDDFLRNDQGIKVEPFFSGNSIPNVNIDDNSILNQSQGVNPYYQGKSEQAPLFEPTAGLSNVFGSTFGEGIGDPSRYEAGQLMTNQLPFVQEQVSQIDEKSDFNREIGGIIADRLNIDNLRTANNQKTSEEGRIIGSGSQISNRGKQGMVFQHKPNKIFDNPSERWLKTTGAVTGQEKRPQQILPTTNRSVFNRQEFGIAGNSGTIGMENRPAFKKSLNQQLSSDTTRNVGVETAQYNGDIHQSSYQAYPNEREVTGERTHTTNVAVENSNRTMDPFQPFKKTIKESTIHSKNNGYINNTEISPTIGLMDDVRKTKKQTTINSKNNGYLKGDYEGRTSSFESPENTTKDSTLFSYTGTAGGGVFTGNMEQDNYHNAETNPTKEIIAQGRKPTLSNVKLANGKDQVKINIKKIEEDYMNHYVNGPTRVYQEIPYDQTCEVTTMKDRLEEIPLSERIDPNLLNPFNNNPYTQSLGSYAYS